MSYSKLFIVRKYGFLRYTSFAIVLFVTFLARLYKIDSPLWLDEIYGYRLAQLGFEGIIQNSWTDPHPPLYYFMQWVVSGFGYSRSEIIWRLIPLLSGVLLVPMLGIIVEDITDSFTSIIICLIVLDFCKVQLDERQVRLDFGQTPPLFGSLDNPGDGFPQDLA